MTSNDDLILVRESKGRVDANNPIDQTRIEVVRSAERYAQVRISPLDGGYGTTLGNALRRVLLSSLGGAAITSVRVSGVFHEFAVIPNAREDTTRLLLNLKQIRFKSLGEGSNEWRITLSARGEGLVTAADIQLPSDLEVANPEQGIITLDSHDADLQLDFVVRRGRGYSPAEERGKLPIGELPVDAIFSPIRRVSYDVTKTRVGRLSDHDSLSLEIWTDGTVQPDDALRQASQVLAEHFLHIADFGSTPVVEPGRADQGIPMAVYETAIEDLELSVRAYNCLKRAGLTRVGEILERMAQGDDEMLVIRNFGQKSLDELRDAMIAKGYYEYMPAPAKAG